MKSDDDKMEGGGGSQRSNEHLSPNLNSIVWTIHQVLTNWSYIHAGGNHITISFLAVQNSSIGDLVTDSVTQ